MQEIKKNIKKRKLNQPGVVGSRMGTRQGDPIGLLHVNLHCFNGPMSPISKIIQDMCLKVMAQDFSAKE